MSLLNNLITKIKTEHKIMFIWEGTDIPSNFQETVEKLQAATNIKISVEHSERLSMSNHQQSSFDIILSNLLTKSTSQTSQKSLVNYLSLLKPNGKYIEIAKDLNTLESELKMNGYKNVITEKIDDNMVYQAEKPDFEVGAKSKLKFKSKPAENKDTNGAQKVWKFSANDMNEDDLINTDDLLDDLDLKKPEVQVRDCGTSKEGKKKACKGCVCGLAEEIEAEATGQIKKNNAPAAKSACGSCFLGDAFRCASCPYLGMPAFKAGEKIQISESLLKADI